MKIYACENAIGDFSLGASEGHSSQHDIVQLFHLDFCYKLPTYSRKLSSIVKDLIGRPAVNELFPYREMQHSKHQHISLHMKTFRSTAWVLSYVRQKSGPLWEG